MSAVVAQMLQTLQLSQPPWTASAALFISVSLSSMAVIIALHHTTFLNCVSFHPSLDAKLKRIFRPTPVNSDGKNHLRSRRVWLGTLIYSIPEVLLSHSIICSFTGVGLIAVSPLWTRLDDVWDGPQKVSPSMIYWINLDLIRVMVMVFRMLKPFLYPRILTSVLTNKVPGLDGLREHCRTLCCHSCVFRWGALSIHSRSHRRDVW